MTRAAQSETAGFNQNECCARAPMGMWRWSDRLRVAGAEPHFHHPGVTSTSAFLISTAAKILSVHP